MNIYESLTILFANFYKKMKREENNYIPDIAVAKEILIPMYEKFVREGLTPIEKLTKDEKMNLVNECRNTGDTYTNKTLIEQCKILYLLKLL